MDVIRVMDLKAVDDSYMFEREEDPMHIKEAMFYLFKKTEEMTDEEYYDWLCSKSNNGVFSNDELMALDSDVCSPSFSFLNNIYKENKLLPAINLVIILLCEVNGI